MVPGLEEATAHSIIHTLVYHMAVLARLTMVNPSNQANGRKALQIIRYDILNDDFDY